MMLYMQNSTSINNAKPERLIWPDFLRGILIILVIVGHAVQATYPDSFHEVLIWNVIYSFHMPAFIAISGWLAFKKEIPPMGGAIKKSKLEEFCAYCKRRFYQLMMPYLIWSFIRYLVSGEYNIHRLLEIITLPDSYFWFLWVLFWICIVHKLLNLISKCLSINDVFLNVLVCAFLFAISAIFNVKAYGISSTSYYFYFYLFGYYVHRYCDGFSIPKVVILFGIICWGGLACSWSQHNVPSWLDFVSFVPASIMNYVYRIITATIAVFAILAGMPYITVNTKSKLNQYTIILGQLSLGIYVVHILLLHPMIDLFNEYVGGINKAFLVCVATILLAALSFAIVWIFSVNKTISRIFLGK